MGFLSPLSSILYVIQVDPQVLSVVFDVDPSFSLSSSALASE